MAHDHGSEYQIRIVHADGTEREPAKWMNREEQLAQTMRSVECARQYLLASRTERSVSRLLRQGATDHRGMPRCWASRRHDTFPTILYICCPWGRGTGANCLEHSLAGDSEEKAGRQSTNFADPARSGAASCDAPLLAGFRCKMSLWSEPRFSRCCWRPSWPCSWAAQRRLRICCIASRPGSWRRPVLLTAIFAARPR